MVRFFSEWYTRKFSDPQAVTLLVILVSSFLFVYFFSDLLMPVFVALAIAFLLDLPVNRLKALGLSRTMSVTIVVSAFVGFSLVTLLGLMPLVWQQGSNLLQELPTMISEVKIYLLALPEKYPEIIQASQIETIISATRDKFIEWGEVILQVSLNSISNLVALIIYLILVPIMVFFFLKDKKTLLNEFTNFLPQNRKMATEVSDEMNRQILNYIRGKLIEILIIGGVSMITFALLDLRYTVLLGVLVGLSVLVPYVGATLVTLPVMLVAFFQWGISPEFGTVMIAYGIIQALDGNLLVPILFSEAVNLHPVTIIVAVILFGGLWGFWGVFFAIPLATLVKAVLNAWPKTSQPQEFIEEK
ncbi:AI-2E family transporter [Thalassotalea atypica]|uniref:AI-2E family transporter n=1 Tax=Thalassotalea atypica TaxID=2054316 RepID=UPI002572EF6F|nr:AI-2E family transporter [Thalassotalea atypica]